MPDKTQYEGWSQADLVRRLRHLENRVESLESELSGNTIDGLKPSKRAKPSKRSHARPSDASRYSTRLIALKFAYLGHNYNGFEFHKHNDTPLQTVEEVLWRALDKTNLIFPTPDLAVPAGSPNWDGCDYSKCGRTDRGVSAFGQVIGIRVRSNRPVKAPVESDAQASLGEDPGSIEEITDTPRANTAAHGISSGQPAILSTIEAQEPFPVAEEIPYCQILNRVLPPDIRMLAWCPTPPGDFSARFNCEERRYEYFFTQPAFNPSAGAAGLADGPPGLREGFLDIEKMRIAAKKYEGLHDFRNFCRVDPSKQIDNFDRRMYYSDILPLGPGEASANYIGSPHLAHAQSSDTSFSAAKDARTSSPASTRTTINSESPAVPPPVWVFRLHGSSFLWHQVRHMVAILFLIGQGLEKPELVDQLLDVSRNSRKPQYSMASDGPLVLRDCIFPDSNSAGRGDIKDNSDSTQSRVDGLNWIYVGDYLGQEAGIKGASGGKGDSKYGLAGITEEPWRAWRQHKMNEILAGQMLNVVAAQGGKRWDPAKVTSATHLGSQKAFEGGDTPRLVGKYVPVMEKPRNLDVDTINAMWREKKGK